MDCQPWSAGGCEQLIRRPGHFFCAPHPSLSHRVASCLKFMIFPYLPASDGEIADEGFSVVGARWKEKLFTTSEPTQI